MSSVGAQRTVKVTLTVGQTPPPPQDGNAAPPSTWRHPAGDRERKSGPQSADETQHYYGNDRTTADGGGGDDDEPADRVAAPRRLRSSVCPFYSELKASSPYHHRIMQGAQRYKRDQLIEMVQKSLAENLSFQNQRYKLYLPL